jgi:MFS family permease
MTAFSLPLASVHAQVAAAGVDAVGASMLTTVFYAGIVCGELLAAGVISRIGLRRATVAGLIGLGVPSLVAACWPRYELWVLCNALRGVGFAFVVIATAAIVAAAALDDRLGSALGHYGLIVGVPSLVALPLGLVLADSGGYRVVLIAAAAAALGVLPLARRLPRAAEELGVEPGSAPDGANARGRRPDGAGMRDILASSHVVAPLVALALAAASSAVLIVLVPIAPSAPSAGLWALMALAASAPAARFSAGRLGDRLGSRTLLVPGLVLCVTGLAFAVMADHAPALVAGSLFVGCGFGVVQNASLQALCEKRPARELAAASALWNFAYDLGLAVGGSGVGIFLAAIGTTPA